MSSKNPFRHPPASTSKPEVAISPPSPPLPALPSSARASSPELPPIPADTAASDPSSHRNPPENSELPPPPIDEDDLPPPYTPAANAGEETIGLGPRRPFQQAPTLPSSSRHHTRSQRPQPLLQPVPTGQGTPGAVYYSQPNSWQPQPQALAPWQTQQQYRQRQNGVGGGGLLGALFDSVRDIADVVSGTADDRMGAMRRANAGAYAVPYSNGGVGSAYTPPPGPPPPLGPPQPPPGPPPRRPSSTPPSIPDDGTPTQTPVPGHPLLRDGHLLVYPRDHLCVKCKNTGYKNYDPLNPCRKCWEKYGRQYVGALTYTPWKPSGNDPRMQRALPRFVPPHLAGPSASSSCAAYAPSRGPPPHPLLPPPQHPYHTRSVSQPLHSPTGPSYFVMHPLGSYDVQLPVPDAIPVSPGDPRLGGRLCSRCGGEGIQTVMLFDVEMCNNCGGTGRVWR